MRDVRLSGKTGSDRRSIKSTRLTRCRSQSQHFHVTSLLYLFPHQADDTHLAIATEGGGRSRVGHSIAIYLHVSNDRSASPHFVPRQVDMMLDFFTIERIRSTIGAHRAVQVSTLLISHGLV